MDGSDPNGPLDSGDEVVLGGVREMWNEVDPMPADLVTLVTFAFELAEPVEFLRLAARDAPAAARGEQTRLITFTGSTITVLVDITVNSDDSVRVDGWITPPTRVPVELRTPVAARSTTSDEGGRFVFDGVPHGVAQLFVRSGDGVATPSIVL
ncbi:hypothetical protein ACIRG5_25920 [Lentzea sp. NPDC102401]|uniref:hypothetical protein n=1 Tax=Lentzea sp. NPDC102401 TaxID=3364128 RepID=UPI003826A777